MRTARSYSIVDHELYHGGYLHRLSHEAMGLYLFLAVVGDRDGRSFYGEASIREILRLSATAFTAARSALLDEGLIECRAHYWWVRSLTRPARSAPRAVSRREASDEGPPEMPADPEMAKARLGAILAALGRRRTG